MNGKDLLAALLMVVPGIVLIALMAFTLVPASVLQPFPGSGVVRDDVRKAPDAQSGVEKSQAIREVSARAIPAKETQKRMRDPLASPSYAKIP